MVGAAFKFYDNPLVTSLLTELKLDLKAASVVILSTPEGDFQGQVYLNPHQSGVKNSITLIKVVCKSTGEELPGHHTWRQEEIKSIMTIQDAPKEIKGPKEYFMGTEVIKDQADLLYLVKTIDVMNIKEIGCFIPNCVQGRRSQPKYILLNVELLLVVIPLDDPTFNDLVWTTLGVSIFSNPNIVKIFFNSRHVKEYLFHNHGICLQNLYDLQFLELCIRNPPNMHDWGHPTKGNVSLPVTENPIVLTDLLESYLPNEVPDCDMKFLHEFVAFSSGAEFTDSDKKYCALKVKYLLKLKEEMKMLLMTPMNEKLTMEHKELVQLALFFCAVCCDFLLLHEFVKIQFGKNQLCT